MNFGQKKQSPVHWLLKTRPLNNIHNIGTVKNLAKGLQYVNKYYEC